MSKFELEPFLKPPDHEVRCNNFVEEVNSSIKPKYPELEISAINITEEELNEKLPRYSKFYREHGDQEGYERISKLALNSDQFATLYANSAHVVLGRKTGLAESHNTRGAIIEITQIAEKHSGVRSKGLEELEELFEQIMDKPEIPNIHLRFLFIADLSEN